MTHPLAHHPVLVVLRHAHRDALDRPSDNGISEKGRQQVNEGSAAFKETILAALPGLKGNQTVFLTSPKKRCRETVQSYAQAIGGKLVVSEALDEQGPSELSAVFMKRIQVAAREVKALQENHLLVVVCSHGDWIPDFIDRVSGARVDLSKGAWIAFQNEKRTAAFRPS